MKKKFTREQLEELRDEVIQKQRELIETQEKEIAYLRSELAQAKCDVAFEQEQMRETQRLQAIVSGVGGFSINPFGYNPNIF